MRKTFIMFVALLGLSLSAWSQNQGSATAPTVGKTYYLWNEGQQQYLSSADGRLSLGRVPLSVTIASRDDVSGTSFGSANDGFVLLNADGGALAASPFLSPRADGQGKYREWTLQAADSTGSYVVACRFHDSNTAAFLYHSELTDSIGMVLTQPDSTYLDGLWQLVSADEMQVVALSEDDSTYTQPTLTAPSATVLLKRTFTLGQWNTLSVPFSITFDQLKAQWGDDVQVARFTGIDGTTLLFTPTDSVEAGVPCLVKPSKDVEEGSQYYEFSGVTAFAGIPTVVSQTAGEATVTFQSAYKVTTVPAGALLVDNTEISRASAAEPMKGFSGYLLENGTTATTAITGWRLVDPSTGINTITTDTLGTVKVYNVQGQRMNDTALPHGVYIINGKKVIK